MPQPVVLGIDFGGSKIAAAVAGPGTNRGHAKPGTVLAGDCGGDLATSEVDAEHDRLWHAHSPVEWPAGR